jgi:type IV fimbrial biogenesis protein FimT
VKKPRLINGNKMKLKKNSRGFTLVELMIVVTVLIILAGVAIPSFKNMMASQRVKSASYELFASLMLTRSEAIKRNSDVTIAPVNGEWQQGWTVTATAADGTVTVIKKHSALNQIMVSEAPTSLVYKRTGRLSATASPSFQLDVDPADTNFTRCISIELSGLPKTAKGACP